MSVIGARGKLLPFIIATLLVATTVVSLGDVYSAAPEIEPISTRYPKALRSEDKIYSPAVNLLEDVPTFVETFDGSPSAPESWTSDRWQITAHSRDINRLYDVAPMMAGHGPNCEPPPAVHEISEYSETVYQCKDHVMTAIQDPGYAVIYLTPNQLVDFSDGEAIVRFDVSTQRTSFRDWIDLWVTPYEDHLQLPLDNDLPDLSGEPRNGLHIRMEFTPSSFSAFLLKDFQVYELQETNDGWNGYESFLTPDFRRRDTFELSIRNNHIRFGMPDYGFYWVDTDIEPLGWKKGVVQFGHHSYNPTKCEGNECRPNTWHWDNIVIKPASPFTLLNANQRAADASTDSRITFSAPAPARAFLRFAGIGNNIEVSYDGGATWQAADVQNQKEYPDDKFWSYWMPIPEGVQDVQFRGENWWGGPWHVRDISIWAFDDD